MGEFLVRRVPPGMGCDQMAVNVATRKFGRRARLPEAGIPVEPGDGLSRCRPTPDVGTSAVFSICDVSVFCFSISIRRNFAQLSDLDA